MNDKPAQASAALPIEVRNKIREWLSNTYGRDHPAVPIDLIQVLKQPPRIIYRVEINVSTVTKSGHRDTVYLEVYSEASGSPIIDQEMVVFFD
jgi:hypothetical protein